MVIDAGITKYEVKYLTFKRVPTTVCFDSIQFRILYVVLVIVNSVISIHILSRKLLSMKNN